MTNPLKILIWHWGRRGGGPRYTLELTKALCTHRDIELYLSLSLQSEFSDEFNKIEVIEQLNINTYNNFFQFLIGSLKLPFLKWRFSRFLREHQIDVVLCTMDHLWNGFIAGTIRDAGAFYILTVHDASRHPGENQPWRQWLLARDIVLADGIIVLTHAVGKEIKRLYNYSSKRIYKAAHGHFGDYILDTPRELPTMRPIRLLFFGRILPYKGLHILLDMFSDLQKKYPDIELEIWGSGDISAYQDRINRLSSVRIENRWIDEHEISGIFEHTDLLILPYEEASQSGVVGMAQAYGMPSIATPISGLKEQIHHKRNGLLANEISASSLIEEIVYLLENPEEYKRLSQGCIKTAHDELSWDNIGNSVLAGIRKLREVTNNSNGKDIS